MPPLKRVRYFIGQLLSANDFAAEQEYFRSRHRRHNLSFHGTGVVSGLRVRPGGGQIVVSPGIAIDARGNELTLEQPSVRQLPADGDVALLALRFVERDTDPVPATGSRPEEGGMEPSRIEESAELAWIETPDGEEGVVLARLRRKKRGWRPDRTFRRARARR